MIESDDDINSMDFSLDSATQPLVTTLKTVCAYPAEWVETFGDDYYRHAQTQELRAFSETGVWNVYSEGQAFTDSPLRVTGEKEIEIHIARIIDDMKRNGGQAGG